MQHFILQFPRGAEATYFYRVNRKFHSAPAKVEGHTATAVKITYQDAQGHQVTTRVKPANLCAMPLDSRISSLPADDQALILALSKSAPGAARVAIAQQLADLVLNGLVLHHQYYLAVDPRSCVVNDYQSLIHLEGPAGEQYITFPCGFTFLASKC